MFCVAYRITKLLRCHCRCFHGATVGFYSILTALIRFEGRSGCTKTLPNFLKPNNRGAQPKPSPTFSNLIRMGRWLENVQWWWLLYSLVMDGDDFCIVWWCLMMIFVQFLYSCRTVATFIRFEKATAREEATKSLHQNPLPNLIMQIILSNHAIVLCVLDYRFW